MTSDFCFWALKHFFIKFKLDLLYILNLTYIKGLLTERGLYLREVFLFAWCLYRNSRTDRENEVNKTFIIWLFVHTPVGQYVGREIRQEGNMPGGKYAGKEIRREGNTLFSGPLNNQSACAMIWKQTESYNKRHYYIMRTYLYKTRGKL